jgi:prepilin peptidase CpaA
MGAGVSNILVAMLALMLLAAAMWDLKSRTIPNMLNAAIAAGAVPFWWASGLALWPDIALHVAVAAGVFAIFALAFAVGAMGGGDVKMVAAVALWMPYQAVLLLLVVMSIAGGALTIAMVVRHRLAKAEHKIEVPYGVAIAFGGLWLISERFLYQFG